MKRTPVFNFVAGNAIKIGVPEIFLEKHKWSTTIYVCWFFIYILLTRNYTTARFLGVYTKGLLNVKNATTIGVSGLWGEQKAGPKTEEIDAIKNGVPRSVREWGAYVAQHERPVFEGIGWQAAGLFFKRQFGSDEEVSPGGKHVFFFLSGCIWNPPQKSMFEPLKSKKAPRNWTQQHIYIWLGPGHLPTFLGSKPICHPCLAKKKAFFFYTNLC